MKQREGGFTLIEILVTIGLFGVTVTALSYMFLSIQNIQRQAAYMDIATRSAQAEIETLRSEGYDSLTPGSISFSNQLYGLPGGSTASAQVTQSSGDVRRIDASVTYTFIGSSHTVTLTTLVGAIGLTE